MEDRILDANEHREDNFEATIRPVSLNEYIGQSEVKENLDIFMKAAKMRVLRFHRQDQPVRQPSDGCGLQAG